MEARRVDRETAESVAGVARLLRRAAALDWVRADREGPRSSAQMLALGLDVAADEAVRLLPDGFDADSPVPPGRIPAVLVSSADQLLRRLVATDTSWGLIAMQGRVSGLLWEGSADADGSQHRSPRPATSAKITDKQTDPSRSQCETLRLRAPTEEHRCQSRAMLPRSWTTSPLPCIEHRKRHGIPPGAALPARRHLSQASSQA